MKIYWDQILVETNEQRADYQLHRLSADSADLRYKGFPLFSSSDGKQPKTYSYNQPSTEEWKVHLGAYTRFGNVLPLLGQRDDMFVITRSGDEIEVMFEVASLPQVREGWVRDYIVYVDGFGKDMDPNSAAPYFLGPLPFHGMSSFPYPSDEHYPDSEAHQQYLREWNTRNYYRSFPELSGSRSAY
jgi:hypothetical protein